MLIKSAESGDISSMCMLSYLPLTIMFGSDAKRYIEIGERYLAVGAERGHGACLAARGVLQFQKIFSADYKTVLAKKYNPEKGFPDLIEAARQGYYSAHRMMYFLREEDLREREYAIRNPLELDRVLCWGRLAQQHTNWAGFDVLLSTMRGVLQPRIEPRYLPQLDLYDPSKVPITRKVATPEKCIALEQQGDSK